LTTPELQFAIQFSLCANITLLLYW